MLKTVLTVFTVMLFAVAVSGQQEITCGGCNPDDGPDGMESGGENLVNTALEDGCVASKLNQGCGEFGNGIKCAEYIFDINAIALDQGVDLDNCPEPILSFEIGAGMSCNGNLDPEVVYDEMCTAFTGDEVQAGIDDVSQFFDRDGTPEDVSGVLPLSDAMAADGFYQIIICGSSNNQGLKNVSIENCCSFEAECKLDDTPQDITGCSLDDLPDPITDINEVFTNIGDDPCGTLVMTSNIDPGSGEICGDGLNVVRAYTLFDDLNDNGDRDPGEEFVGCAEYFVIKAAPLEIECPDGGLISCAEDIGMISADNATVTGACPMANVSVTGPVIDGEPNCTGTTYTYTYTVIDACQREESCDQVFTISSSFLSIECPDPEMATCSEDIDPSIDDVTVEANCDIEPMVTIEGPVVTGDPDCPGTTYAYTFKATSPCFPGTFVSCQQVFTIANEAAELECPQGGIVECAEDIEVGTIPYTPTCGEEVLIEPNGPVVDGDPDCPGTTYTYTYEYTDACGREVSCEQVFTIENEKAVLSCPPAATVECIADFVPTPELVEIVSAPCDIELSDVQVRPIVYVGEEGRENCDGERYRVRYRVIDACGRRSTCRQFINIENEINEIDCPAGGVVECSSDIVVGPIPYTPTCGEPGMVSPTGPVIVGTPDCPGTTYTYTYSYTDNCGRTTSCDQVFTIENAGPTIAVVPTQTVDCVESINPGPVSASVTTSCELGYDISVTDPVLLYGSPNCPGAAYRVTFTIEDVCGRTASTDQTYYIENEGPSMECPDDCVVLSCYDGDYNHVIDAWLESVTATSSCSDDLTVYNNFYGVYGICVGDFTPVTFTAYDDCGRSVSCESGIFIVDTDAPDISGTPEELLVPCTGVTEDIFADWLADRGGITAYDACGGPVYWSTVPSNPYALLDCSNGPQVIMVEFVATDGCGNSSSVTGTFNTKVLPSMINVSGLIQTESAQAVANVQVAAMQSAGATFYDTSNDNGDYELAEVDFEENTEIVPSRDGDWLNGLSTFDLVVLQQHILQIQTLDSPYKLIAADANRSGTVSTLDLVLLRRLILQIDEELVDNTSWRFVDADFVFPNPANPFEAEFPEAYNVAGEETELADFVAVKIGDLNLDAVTNNFSNGADDRTFDNTLKFEAEDQKLKAGMEYQVDITAANFDQIRGFQMTLDYNNSLISILDIQQGALIDFAEQNYNLSRADEGVIPMSWNHTAGQELGLDDVAFSIIIKANADINLSEALAISSRLTKAEAYQANDFMGVELSFGNALTNATVANFKLYQNQPNPFKDATMIGFDLPKSELVKLNVFDLTGKLIYTQEQEFAAGYNQFEINRAQLPQSGVFYYHINTEDDSASKKMIILD